ncbi:MAG TPA: MnhB domain-containing protein [Phycisphaerae bacterium]|nr:MnhB domain-containing protein [Phycisphaerae bacterium]HUT60912.1 MnhB domain-containing protein [Phycisphaerae bacterium]
MMTQGMSLIVKNTAKLVTGFIAVFGIYIAMTGHLSPGGGFAGGVILAAAAVLVILAFGRRGAKGLITDAQCHAWDGAGALAFAVVALCGYFSGQFFVNFIPRGKVHDLASGGMIPLANLAILVKVGAGLAGAFLALAAFRRLGMGKVA